MNNETVSSCLWVFHFKYIPHSVHQNSYTLLFKFIFIAYSILFHSRQFCFNSLSNLLEILRIHKHIIHRWFGICYPPFLFWFFFLFSFGQVSTYLYHPFHTKSFTLWSIIRTVSMRKLKLNWALKAEKKAALQQAAWGGRAALKRKCKKGLEVGTSCPQRAQLHPVIAVILFNTDDTTRNCNF